MIGVRDTLAYRLTDLEIKTKEDDLTEHIKLEIPLEKDQKLRIINIYVPPVRGRVDTFKPRQMAKQ